MNGSVVFNCKKSVNFLQEVQNFSNEVDFYQKRSFVGELFYNSVGIVRRKQELKDAQKIIVKLKEQLPLMGVKDKSKVYNTNLLEFLEFRNMLDVCEAVLEGALMRKESCGAHYMEVES